jgi:RNA-directed DNA polymerase
MKRHGSLFEKLVSWANLLRAAHKAGRRKSGRLVVQRFDFRREWELLRLQKELISGEYRPGPFTTHRISHPKPRLISAAPFRDRVVHHAVMNGLEPLLERHFHPHSYACRQGKGTHAASRRLQELMRRSPFALQCDVRQFFPSIDHALLKELFRRRLKDERLLALLDRIVDGSNPQDDALEWFPGDDLFTPLQHCRGLPIGNLTSQWFANWYLDGLDHFVTSHLRIGGYVRYCDDFVLLHSDQSRLAKARAQLIDYLARWRLRLHPGKTAIIPVRAGLTFVGYRTWPGRREVRGSNMRSFLNRLRQWRTCVDNGDCSLGQVRQHLMGWLGHAMQGDPERLRARLRKRWPFTIKT